MSAVAFARRSAEPSDRFDVVLCVGGTCRRSKGHRKLRRLVEDDGRGFTVPCQGLCRGPVVGLHRNGELRWYAKVRGRGRRLLGAALADGSWRRLRPVEARSRRGRLRHADRVAAIEPAIEPATPAQDHAAHPGGNHAEGELS